MNTTKKDTMNITVENAMFIVKNGNKRVDQKTGELIGYDLNAFYRFREAFICKDAVSGYMVMDTRGGLSDGVVYKYYNCNETARKILNFDI